MANIMICLTTLSSVWRLASPFNDGNKVANSKATMATKWVADFRID